MKTMTEGDRLDRMESVIAGAVDSIAALTELSQAKLPFFVVRHFQIVPPSGGPNTYPINMLAQQLVQLKGLIFLFPPAQLVTSTTTGAASPWTTTPAFTMTECVLEIGSLTIDILGSGGIVLPNWSRFLRTNDTVQVVVNGVPSGNTDTLTVHLWGEQVPTTGMVS